MRMLSIRTLLLTGLLSGLAAAGAQEEIQAPPSQPTVADIPRLIRQLGTDDMSGMSASRQLGQIGTPAVPALLASLKAKEPRARYWSTSALSEIGDDRAVPAIVELLDDADGIVRAVAVWHLGRWYERPEVRTAVLEKLSDPDPFVRGWVLRLIQARHDRSALVEVRKLLDAGEPEVRYDALHTIVLLAGDAALPLLAQVVRDDESPLVRECAVRCCTLIEPPDAATGAVLIAGLRDKDEAVRKASAALLRKGFGHGFGFQADGEPPEREEAVRRWRVWYDEHAAVLKWDAASRCFEIPAEAGREAGGAAHGADAPAH